MPLLTGGKVIEGARQRYRGNATVGYGPYWSAGAPAAGFLNNVAQPGAVVETDTGQCYVNTGTLAATVWTLQGSLI